ncbi:GMP synthase [Rhodobacter sp.]
MRIAIVENTAATNHGQVGVALHEAGARIDLYKPWTGQPLPDTVDADALVVFGGEQSALDDHTHPYLPKLAQLMADYTATERAVLGICLGSQVLARAFGAQNLLGKTPEFGWMPVTLTDEGAADPVLGALPRTFPIYQWHSDTFTLPEGAVQLARSAAVAQQGFRIGRASYGTQFHFEANRAVVRDWKRSFGDLMAASKPVWAFEEEAATLGRAADGHGLTIARAWVAQI